MSKSRLYIIRFRDESRRVRTFRTTASSSEAAAHKLKSKGTIISVTKSEGPEPYPEFGNQDTSQFSTFYGFDDPRFFMNPKDIDSSKNGNTNNKNGHS